MHFLRFLNPKFWKKEYVSVFWIHIKNILIMPFFAKYRQSSSLVLRKRQINGMPMLISLNDSIGRQLYVHKNYEILNTLGLKKLVKKGWTCMDVGANVGYYTLLFADLVGKQGHVFAFEPNPVNVEILDLNMKQNGFNSVRIVPKILSDNIGQKTLYITEDSGFSSMQDTSRSKVKRKITIPTTTLDAYVNEFQIQRIDCIKLDVEGAEKMILDGAKRVLEKLQPQVLLIELQNDNLFVFNTSIRDIMQMMKVLGYQAYTHHLKDGFRKHTSGDSPISENVFFIKS